ncbi:MAG: HAD family hydrolase [Anaerostipes sp.]
MIKLISSDMDGTLLDSYRQITPINIEAIKKLRKMVSILLSIQAVNTPMHVLLLNLPD